MFRDIGLMRACTALALVAMLNLIAVGCGLPVRSLPDNQPSGQSPVLIEKLPDALSQIELTEISDHHAIFVVYDVSGAPVTVEVRREDLSNTEQRLSVVANGKPISLETLSTQGVLALQDNTARIEPQSVPPQIWLGLTVSLFLWECGGALYRHYVQQAKPLADAVKECVIAGVAAILGHFTGPEAREALMTALGKVVTAQALKGIRKELTADLVRFVAGVLYQQILTAIKNVAAQLRTDHRDPVPPTIVSISWQQSGTISVTYKDQDGDVSQIIVERKRWPWWYEVIRWTASKFPNSEGSVNFAICSKPEQLTIRVTVIDLGKRSTTSREQTIRCVR